MLALTEVCRWEFGIDTMDDGNGWESWQGSSIILIDSNPNLLCMFLANSSPTVVLIAIA